MGRSREDLLEAESPFLPGRNTMSPTATIASVVVALLFFAWLFQSDIKDPGYEAWVKRQQEEMKNEKAQKASMGISVTDAGVTKDNSTLESRRSDLKGSGGYAGGDVDLVVKGTDGVPLQDATAEISSSSARRTRTRSARRTRTGLGRGRNSTGRSWG